MSSSDKPSAAQIRNPKTHYGNGKAATRGFITQRVTGALNIVFTLFFIWFVVSLAGADTAGKLALVGNPLVAIVLAAMVVVVGIHMRNGMHDVIADYFTGSNYRLANAANTIFTLFVVVAALLSLAKLVFWG
jgi:succinate dehydrogenase / fumarate reductase membrane anchor subunit